MVLDTDTGSFTLLSCSVLHLACDPELFYPLTACSHPSHTASTEGTINQPNFCPPVAKGLPHFLPHRCL
jgi:hypothetical protein